MKFFKWRITTKIEQLDLDDRIIYLAEQLLKETKKKADWNTYVDGLDYIAVNNHLDTRNLYIQYGNKEIKKEYGGIYAK